MDGPETSERGSPSEGTSRGLYVVLLEATGGAGLSWHLDLIGPAREKIFLELGIQHFQLQEVCPEFFRDRGQGALRLFDVQRDSFRLQWHIEIFLAESQVLLWL